MKENAIKLGRWHKWWLKQFKRQYDNGKGGQMVVSGWEGTVQGKALVGLLQRGMIEYKVSFEGGMTILAITDKGLANSLWGEKAIVMAGILQNNPNLEEKVGAAIKYKIKRQLLRMRSAAMAEDVKEQEKAITGGDED